MWNPINFFRGKRKSKEEVEKILTDLKALKSGTVKAVKATAKSPQIQAVAITAGTAAAPFVPAMAPAYAPQEARNIVYHRAEVVAADAMRKLIKDGRALDENTIRQIREATARDVGSRYPKFKIEEMLSEKELTNLMNAGIASAAEQVGYYEQQFGRFQGQGVRNIEQFGAAASYAAKKAGLFGKVETGRWERGYTPKEKLVGKLEDPKLRSAINEARLKLQKEATKIGPKLDEYKTEIEKELEEIGKAIKQDQDGLEKVRQKIQELQAKEHSPGHESGGPSIGE